MNRYILIFSVVLILQLSLAGLLFIKDTNSIDGREQTMLVHIDASKINKIEITEGEKTLLLTKTNSQWQLADYPALTLTSSKVDAIAETLGKKTITWPVTTTSASHKRFKVSADDYEKKVVFSDTEGNKQTLLLGKSPRFKQLYARNLETEDVYSIAFSAYQLSIDPDSWLDKSLLALDSISNINHSVMNLTKNEHNWLLEQASSLNEHQSLDTEAIEELANQLTQLSIMGIAKLAPTATDTLTVTDNNNAQYVYSFAADADNFYVKRSDIDQWFTLTKTNYDAFAKLSLQDFVIDEQVASEEKTTVASD